MMTRNITNTQIKLIGYLKGNTNWEIHAQAEGNANIGIKRWGTNLIQLPEDIL
jgi:hypothetical protein